ncbi:unnamed protein product [Tenebrio molitor]|nr:unnamed protein product [Tenebrio molitor]
MTHRTSIAVFDRNNLVFVSQSCGSSHDIPQLNLNPSPDKFILPNIRNNPN